jgi:tRNA wybutosine-synthesizing protein 1
MPDWDDPETIVDGCIKSQLSILSGYRANSTLNIERYKEALEPKHAAISLDGEPTLYPELGELVKEFHKKGLTTFIVTNGTMPDVLTNLSEEPTQLYVSLTASDEEHFQKVCRPLVPNAWQKLNRTLEALPSFSCPTVIRLTSVRNLNMENPEKYAKLIEKANPTYIEPKGYVYVGLSRKRLKFENMPTHSDIRQFAQQLSELTGYKIIDESPDNLVVLLSRLDKPIKLA